VGFQVAAKLKTGIEIDEEKKLVVQYLNELYKTRNPQYIIIEATSELLHQISCHGIFNIK
jgi:hypothetical protein